MPSLFRIVRSYASRKDKFGLSRQQQSILDDAARLTPAPRAGRDPRPSREDCLRRAAAAERALGPPPIPQSLWPISPDGVRYNPSAQHTDKGAALRRLALAEADLAQPVESGRWKQNVRSSHDQVVGPALGMERHLGRL